MRYHVVSHENRSKRHATCGKTLDFGPQTTACSGTHVCCSTPRKHRCYIQSHEAQHVRPCACCRLLFQAPSRSSLVGKILYESERMFVCLERCLLHSLCCPDPCIRHGTGEPRNPTDISTDIMQIPFRTIWWNPETPRLNVLRQRDFLMG